MDRDRKLRIFAGNEHPFGDRPIEPYVMPPRQVREMRPRARRAMIRVQKKAELQKQGGADTRKAIVVEIGIVLEIFELFFGPIIDPGFVFVFRVFILRGHERWGVLGRLASQISTVIQGKDKPTYAPNRDDGDMCIVLNAKDICVTGRKLTDKFYRWHTGYIGHLKKRSLKDQLAKDPTEVIRKAVLRMLPRNKLRDDRDRKLRIFAGNEHPFGDRPIEPYVMPPRQVREMRPRARRAMICKKKQEDTLEINA
ncbi:unnamed protein product [Camellia sinensis]